MSSLKEAFAALADKPIHTSSEWFKQSYTDKEKIPADLYCPTCGRIKTFVGNSYSYQETLNVFARSMAQQGQQLSAYNDDTYKRINEILAEALLSYDNIMIIKLTCPVCDSRIYLAFAVGTESRTIAEGSKSIKTNFYQVIKIGEYPNQDLSRLLILAKYQARFPVEYDLLVKAVKSYQLGLGAGAMVYIRKAYESLLFGILDEASIPRPKTFKDTLELADNTKHIVPAVLTDKAYGLFGEISDVVHGDAEDADGITKYEDLRDVFLLILDNIIEQERTATIAARIRADKK
jgi:hypothetical protein